MVVFRLKSGKQRQSLSLQYTTINDIPGRNRPRIQFKSALIPGLRCREANSTDVPIKIDFPAQHDFFLDISTNLTYNRLYIQHKRKIRGVSYMTTACIAIIIIVLISSYMCYRKGYMSLGRSVFPIALVPIAHILGTNIIVPLMRAGSLLKESAAEMSIVTAVDVAACVASSAIIIVISKGLFKRNATRRTYFTALTVFMAILTMALLINYYNGFK